MTREACPPFRREQAAAAGGDADAQKSLGDIYAQGLGVKQDYAKARYWVEKAAVAGNADAQNDLAVFYERGLGGLKADSAKAKYWLEKSAAQGHDVARMLLPYLKD